MSIRSRLASAMDRRDEQPNIDLAEDIAAKRNGAAVEELLEIVATAPRPLRHDAIKALYETAERRPDMLAPHVDRFLDLLSSKDNRMVWGAMSALAALAPVAPERLMAEIGQILACADRASVIAKDKAMAMLATLSADPRYHETLMPVIFLRLEHAADNQTPMYAEMTAQSLNADDIPRFREIVEKRIADIPQPAKKARLEKLLRRLARG